MIQTELYIREITRFLRTVTIKNVYFDDITGQVKMRATFDCNPYTGKIKLRQIKYLD